MLLGTSQSVALWAALSLCVTLHCGARSELVQPTEVQVERDRPVVMAVFERSVNSVVIAGCNGRPWPYGRWEAIVDAMRAGLSSIDEAALIGGLVYPMNGDRVEGGVQDGSIYCRVDPGGLIEPSIDNASTVMARTDREGQPTGSQAVFEALRLARRALERPEFMSRPRFIVIGNFGAPNCNPNIPLDQCECLDGGPTERCIAFDAHRRTYNCSDIERVAEQIEGFRREGIETIVLGLSCPEPALQRWIDNLNRMAIAGGRPQREGPYRFYVSTQIDTFRAALDETILPLGICRLRVSDSSIPDDAAMQYEDGSPIPFDSSGQNGWRWTERASGRIEVVGAHCRDLVRRRDTPRLFVPARVTR